MSNKQTNKQTTKKPTYLLYLLTSTMSAAVLLIVISTWLFVHYSFPRASFCTKLLLANAIICFDFEQKIIGYLTVLCIVIVVLWYYFLMVKTMSLLEQGDTIMVNIVNTYCRWFGYLLVWLLILGAFLWYFGHFWIMFKLVRVVPVIFAGHFVVSNLDTLQFTNKHFRNGQSLLPPLIRENKENEMIRRVWGWTNYNKMQKKQRLYEQYFNDYRGISSVVTDEILSYGGQSNDYCYRCEQKLNLHARPGECISIHPCGHVFHQNPYCTAKENQRKYDENIFVFDWESFGEWGSTLRPRPKSWDQCNVCYGSECLGTLWSRKYSSQIQPFNCDHLFFTHKINSFITKLFTEINRDLFEPRR